MQTRRRPGHRHNRRHRRRCHRHRRQPCRTRHRGHRAGCRHSRNHLRGCRRSRARRSLRARCRPRGVQGTDAIVDIVADAIGIGVGRAGPTTDTEGIELVAVLVAITFGNVGAALLVDLSGPLQTPQASRAPTQSSTSSQMPSASASAPDPPQTEGIELVAVTVAITFGDVGAAALVDLSGPVADPAGVQGADTIVDIVADAIGIGVDPCRTTTDTRASSWLPSQSQSPSGMSAAQPRRSLRARCRPRRRPGHRHNRRHRRRCHRHRCRPCRTHRRRRGRHRTGRTRPRQ